MKLSILSRARAWESRRIAISCRAVTTWCSSAACEVKGERVSSWREVQEATPIPSFRCVQEILASRTIEVVQQDPADARASLGTNLAHSGVYLADVVGEVFGDAGDVLPDQADVGPYDARGEVVVRRRLVLKQQMGVRRV